MLHNNKHLLNRYIPEVHEHFPSHSAVVNAFQTKAYNTETKSADDSCDVVSFSRQKMQCDPSVADAFPCHDAESASGTLQTLRHQMVVVVCLALAHRIAQSDSPRTSQTLQDPPSTCSTSPSIHHVVLVLEKSAKQIHSRCNKQHTTESTHRTLSFRVSWRRLGTRKQIKLHKHGEAEVLAIADQLLACSFIPFRQQVLERHLVLITMLLRHAMPPHG